MTERAGFPDEIVADVAAARRLTWWNLFWTTTIIIVVGLAMGSSQAMKTAWVEDSLALVPPVAFLIALRWEAKPAQTKFPYAYDRVNSLGFLIAAAALFAVGALLAKEGLTALLKQEHVTIGTVRMLGRDVWLGWLMIAALTYSIIPPFIIARKELRLAKRLKDKLLHTDAEMKKADWQTGIAGILGVAGLGLGYWWADPVAALLISASVIWDGWKALKVATAELVDGMPRELGGERLSAEAQALSDELHARFPEAKRILLRETGRYIRAEVVGVRPGEFTREDLDIVDCEPWRIDSISFRP